MNLQMETCPMLAIYGYMSKPQMDSEISHIRVMQLKDIVISNLNSLMAERSECSSQNALAKKSGVSQSHVGRILRGESTPTVEMIEALAKALKTAAPQLLSENLGRSSLEKKPDALSDQAARLVERISQLDRSHQSPPALYALIENALDLVAPPGDQGYPGLDKLPEE